MESKSDTAAGVRISDVDTAGGYGAQSIPTLGEAIDRYEREITAKKKGRTEEVSALRTIRAVAGPDLLSLRLEDMNATHIAEYCGQRRATPPKRQKRRGNGAISDSTVGKDLCLVSAIFKAAQRQWGMKWLRNPITYEMRPSRQANPVSAAKPVETGRSGGT